LVLPRWLKVGCARAGYRGVEKNLILMDVMADFALPRGMVLSTSDTYELGLSHGLGYVHHHRSSRDLDTCLHDGAIAPAHHASHR
jgi:hypothetical protein